jgi:hypothetical protein
VDLALQVLGYDLGNRDAAVHAFKLHFVQTEVNATLTASDRDLLHCLLHARAQSRDADERQLPVDWPALGG